MYSSFAMSTIVCQNPTETTLHLKLAAQPPDSPENLPAGNKGFESLQPATWAPKPTFPSLSAKSLELCTEYLGSETGCETVAGGNFFPSASPAPILPNSTSGSAPICKGAAIGGDNTNKWNQITRFPRTPNHNFPPPLTSSLEVRRHSEGGRLILRTVPAPLRNSYMVADRSDGRLRISFLTPEATTAAAGDEEDDEVEEQESSEVEEQESSEAEEQESSESEEKFMWARRCKEGGHGDKWKPAVWVAIS